MLNPKMVPVLRFVFFTYVGLLILGLVLPNLTVEGVAEAILKPMFVDFPYFLFVKIYGFSEYLHNLDYSEYGVIKTFGWMLAWLGSMAATLAVPVFYVGYLIFFCWASVTSVFPRFGFGIINVLGAEQSPTMQNLGHVVMGRATLQDTIDVEVQANAIAEALRKKIT